MGLGCLVLVAGLTLVFGRLAQTAPAEEAALKLWHSLSEDQKKEALLPFNDKERYKAEFVPIVRPGLPVSKLSKEQKVLLEQAVGAITTKYGAQRIARVEKQESESKRYLTFYGTPEKGKEFAWRLALHHLTVVYVEFGADQPGEFGPVLLGGNPVGDMWDEEDALFLELYASLSKDEIEKVSGKSGKGAKVADLNAKAKDLAVKLLAKRLEVFNPEYRKNFDLQLKNDGGAENLHLYIKGKDATKSHHKGGQYSWKLFGQHVLCDWDTVGGEHLHLMLKATPVKKAG
jgi:hypothetical protein